MVTQLARSADLFPLLKPASAFIREGETVVLWGDGMQTLYGYSAREVVGRRAADFLRTQAVESIDQMARDVEQFGFWEGKLERFRKDGERRLVDSQWIRVPSAG